MLELIFQGFAEWLYGLILECWEHFSSSLLDIMSLDFAYLQEQIPILTIVRHILLAAGWALLLGNLVFQAARTMMTGIGFEGEDPKLLFTRTFVFSFLLLASPQICEICLDLTSTVMELLDTPDVTEISLLSESAFDGLDAAWLLVIVCGIIVIVQSFKLILELAERYLILAMLTICAPVAFAVGGSRSTADIFHGWCRMYGSMCFLMVSHVIFLNLLLSTLATVPSGLGVLPWIVLILAIVKVAKKADAIITRIGLNPAITGDSLGRSFPGALTYMVLRNVSSHVTKAAANAVIGHGPGRGGGTTPGSRPVAPRDGPNGGGAGAVLSSQTATHQAQAQTQSASTQQSRQNTKTSGQTYGTAAQQTSQNTQTTNQYQTRQAPSSHITPANQAGSVSPFRTTLSRNSAVPPGTRRSPSHIPSAPSSPGTERAPSTLVQQGDVISNGTVIQPPQSNSIKAPHAVAVTPGHSVSPPASAPGSTREFRSTRYTAAHTAASREQDRHTATATHDTTVSSRATPAEPPRTSVNPSQETRFTHHSTENSNGAPSPVSVPGMPLPPSRRSQADPAAGYHSVLSGTEPVQVQPPAPAVGHTGIPPAVRQTLRTTTRQTTRQEQPPHTISPQSSLQRPVPPAPGNRNSKSFGDTQDRPLATQNRPPRPATAADTTKPLKGQSSKRSTRQTSTKSTHAPGGDRYGRR